MTKQLSFDEAKEMHLKQLILYVPIVARVHGKEHPEFHDVHKLFDQVNAKIKEAKSNKPELKEEFAKLREMTSSYKVPQGVCESYEAVYDMLEIMDQAYHQ